MFSTYFGFVILTLITAYFIMPETKVMHFNVCCIIFKIVLLLQEKKVSNRGLVQTWHLVSGLEHKHELKLPSPVLSLCFSIDLCTLHTQYIHYTVAVLSVQRTIKNH